MSIENAVSDHGTYRVHFPRDIDSDALREFEEIATGVPCFDFYLRAQEEGVVPQKLEGDLLRVDISGFSKLNSLLTSISPTETISAPLLAFAILNQARHAQALAYEDIAHLQASSQSTVGQDELIARFNSRFEDIEEIISPLAGRILNIEGDALNIYFPTIRSRERVHQRSLTAGLQIQEMFEGDEDLKARVGVYSIPKDKEVFVTAAGSLVYLTGESFAELCLLESQTTVGAVRTDLASMALLPYEVFYPDGVSAARPIWIKDEETGKATIHPRFTDPGFIKSQSKGRNPYYDFIRLKDGRMELAAEVNSKSFSRARTVKPRKISVSSDQVCAIARQFREFATATDEMPKNIPAVVAYGAIGGISSLDFKSTKGTVEMFTSVFRSLKERFGVDFRKTGIDELLTREMHPCPEMKSLILPLRQY